MIRLFLKRFSLKDCADLYNAFHQSLMILDKNCIACKSIESAMDYLMGYMDAMQEKEGAKQCPHA